jgi:hypothetical protein
VNIQGAFRERFRWLCKTSPRFALKLFLKKFGYDFFLSGAPAGNIQGKFNIK